MRLQKSAVAVLLSAALLTPASTAAQAQAGRIQTATLKAEVDAFFDREVASHFTQIPAEGPLPGRVHGAITTGEYSWGTYVRSLAAYAETRGTTTVAGRDIVPLVGRVGIIESAKGSKAFSQLYAALALRHFGRDLAKNPLWQSLNAAGRAAWTSLLDPTRFYDPKTRQVIDLPENYLGVASRIATLAFQMGVIKDRAFIDSLLARAAEPFAKGALYADDAGTKGRYDRYSNEYARYVYEAAETVGRADLLKALVKEKVDSFPATPNVPAVARFEFFRHGDRPSGVWLVRQGWLRFALPFTTGTRPGFADHLPAPHGLPGFATPVEQPFPAATTYFEMSDGRVLIAGDSADEVVPATDGRSVRATWRRFVAKGGKVGEWIEPGLEVSVAWSIQGSTLTRVETLTATREMTLARVSWVLPSTSTTHTVLDGGALRLTGPEGILEVRTTGGDLGFIRSIQTHRGDEVLGRSARGPIPTHVAYEAANLRLEPGRPRSWGISLSVSAAPPTANKGPGTGPNKAQIRNDQ